MSNTKIWDKVKETHPSGTKRGKVDGQDITTINGMYMAQRATEVFGPCGIGWGYDIIEDRLDYAGPIYEERTGPDGKKTMEHVTDAKNHTIRLKLWYISDGVKGEITHYGHTKYLYRSKYGFTVDPEAPKKSLTDAMKKCLSQLGFCADIYLGLFDDFEYVGEQTRREEVEAADDKAAAILRQNEEHAAWLSDCVRLIGEAKTLPMLEGLFKSAVRKLAARKDQAGLRIVTDAKDAKKKELENAAA